MARGRGKLMALLPMAALGLAQVITAQFIVTQAAWGQARGAAPSRAVQSDPDQGRQDELEMLQRALAERAGRDGAQATEAGAPDSEPGEGVRARAIDAEVAKRLREAEREAELDAVSASIRRSAAARGSVHQGSLAEPGRHSEMPDDLRDARRDMALQETPTRETPKLGLGMGGAERVTVLLVMQPGRTGIRLLSPTADPILCMADVCWISRGPDRDARMVARRKALGPLNTLGDRAGACNGSIGCVFRNVEIAPAAAMVQPVDLRLVRHDRRAALEVGVDRTCRVDGGVVACGAMQAGPDYRLWVVPEAVAQVAGAHALVSTIGAALRPAAQLLR